MRHQITISDELWTELKRLGEIQERTPANMARWLIRKQLRYEKKAAAKTASNQVSQDLDHCPAHDENIQEMTEIVNVPWVKN